MPTPKPTRSTKSDNPDLPTTSEEDLIQLRKYLRTAPSDRAILTCIIALVVTATVSVIAALFALASWMGG